MRELHGPWIKGLPTTQTFNWEKGLSSERLQHALNEFASDVQNDGILQLANPTEDLQLTLAALNVQHPGAAATDPIWFSSRIS